MAKTKKSDLYKQYTDLISQVGETKIYTWRKSTTAQLQFEVDRLTLLIDELNSESEVVQEMKEETPEEPCVLSIEHNVTSESYKHYPVDIDEYLETIKSNDPLQKYLTHYNTGMHEIQKHEISLECPYVIMCGDLTDDNFFTQIDDKPVEEPNPFEYVKGTLLSMPDLTISKMDQLLDANYNLACIRDSHLSRMHELTNEITNLNWQISQYKSTVKVMESMIDQHKEKISRLEIVNKHISRLNIKKTDVQVVKIPTHTQTTTTHTIEKHIEMDSSKQLEKMFNKLSNKINDKMSTFKFISHNMSNNCGTPRNQFVEDPQSEYRMSDGSKDLRVKLKYDHLAPIEAYWKSNQEDEDYILKPSTAGLEQETRKQKGQRMNVKGQLSSSYRNKNDWKSERDLKHKCSREFMNGENKGNKGKAKHMTLDLSALLGAKKSLKKAI